MKNIVLGLGFVALAAFASAGAQALPVAGPVSVDTVVVQAAMGCGRGAHPNGFGACVPNRPRPFFAPRPRYEPRCFVRPTPMGPRRVCR